MDQFDELRKRAVMRRDRKMAAAREEYNETLESIDRLAKLYGGKATTAPYRTLRQTIIDCLPTDRSFSLGDMFVLLEAAEPDRMFPAGSVRGCLHNLEHDGITKRVGRKLGHTLWAHASFEVNNPFGSQTVGQVVGALIRELGPLTLEEMVIHLQARGYRTGDDPKHVHENLRSSLRRIKTGFTRDSKRRWSVVS